MSQHERARTLLGKAAEDEALLDLVLHSTAVSDAIIGFHCQQAAEKLLKAVLAETGVVFRRTHDIVELVDLAIDHGLMEPSEFEDLRELTPFAVELRYESFLDDATDAPLDRDAVRALLRRLRAWADARVPARGT